MSFDWANPKNSFDGKKVYKNAAFIFSSICQSAGLHMQSFPHWKVGTTERQRWELPLSLSLCPTRRLIGWCKSRARAENWETVMCDWIQISIGAQENKCCCFTRPARPGRYHTLLVVRAAAFPSFPSADSFLSIRPFSLSLKCCVFRWWPAHHRVSLFKKKKNNDNHQYITSHQLLVGFAGSRCFLLFASSSIKFGI